MKYQNNNKNLLNFLLLFSIYFEIKYFNFYKYLIKIFIEKKEKKFIIKIL